MVSRSPFESFQWKSDIFNCESTDIDNFYLLLEQEMTRLGMVEKTLGEVGKYDVTHGLPRRPLSTGRLTSTGRSDGLKPLFLEGIYQIYIRGINNK